MTDTRTWKARTGGLVSGLLLSMASVAWSNVAHADEPPVGAPPALEAPAGAPPAMPPPAEMPPPAVPAIEAAVKPPTSTEAMAATRPDVLPPIDVGAWTRIGSVFQGSDPKKLNDWHMNAAYVELHAGGKIHKKVGVTLNLNADMANYGTSSGAMSASIMDAIISFDFQDEFHIWTGHLLVPVDRANASGPFFMIPWNYPGFIAGSPVGAPKEGPFGRNNGLVVWGDISGGKLTYLAGAFDNGNVASSPLFSGRLRLALLDAEPGFWGNGSYFGDKDLFSIGVGGQFQKHGSGVDKDWGEVNADVLFEKKIPGGGWFTAEGAFYHFNVGDGGVDNSYYALLAYATPAVGVGNVQPMVRYQGETVKANTLDNPWNLDVGVSYLIKGPALRLLATYSYTKMLGFDTVSMMGFNGTSNSVQLGAQAIFF